jgi:hypothetical protein
VFCGSEDYPCLTLPFSFNVVSSNGRIFLNKNMNYLCSFVTLAVGITVMCSDSNVQELDYSCITTDYKNLIGPLITTSAGCIVSFTHVKFIHNGDLSNPFNRPTQRFLMVIYNENDDFTISSCIIIHSTLVTSTPYIIVEGGLLRMINCTVKDFVYDIGYSFVMSFPSSIESGVVFDRCRFENITKKHDSYPILFFFNRTSSSVGRSFNVIEVDLNNVAISLVINERPVGIMTAIRKGVYFEVCFL